MIDNKKSLNDILNDYQILENELISSNGEINEDLENKLNLHEKELGDKLDGYEHFVRYLKGKIEYLKSRQFGPPLRCFWKSTICSQSSGECHTPCKTCFS